MTLGIRLRTLRKARHLTQLQLAEMSDVSRIYIQALESNRRSPSMKLLHKLAESLEVEPSDLLEELPNERTGRLQLEEIFQRPEELEIWYRSHKLTSRDLTVVQKLIDAALTDWEADIKKDGK